MARPKFKNAAQNRRAPSWFGELEGVAVGGAASFFESRISFGGVFFPLCFSILPVVNYAGMPAARDDFRSKQARAPSNIRRKKFCRLAFHTGRATA
jgi:hypothetical protein